MLRRRSEAARLGSRARRDRAPPPVLSAAAPYRAVPGADMQGRAGRSVFSSYPCSGRATAAPAACEWGVAPGSPSARRVTRQPCDRPGDQVSATALIGEAGEPDGRELGPGWWLPAGPGEGPTPARGGRNRPFRGGRSWAGGCRRPFIPCRSPSLRPCGDRRRADRPGWTAAADATAQAARLG
jgi:hypothetical protein